MRRAARVARALALLAVLALGACAVPPTRAPADDAPDRPPAPVPGPLSTPPAAAPPAAQPDAKPEQGPASRAPRRALSPWRRMRAGLRFTRCDESEAVQRWTRVYARSGERFTQMLRNALPFLLYVEREVERRGLPAEFVLLPLVESSYVAFESRGNRPAGIWQLMPITARSMGLEVSPRHDARLDTVEATRAALDYLTHLAQAFERDWILVNMAYNAGEFRVRGALKRAGMPRSAAAYRQLPLSRITHDHYAKLSALACLVRAPRAQRVLLPVPSREDRLAALALDADTELVLIAALARTDEARLRALNPAVSGPLARGGSSVLVPSRHARASAGWLARIPHARRSGWRYAPRPQADELTAIAQRERLEPELLVHLAALGEAANMLLPGAPPAPRASTASVDAQGRYVVRAGDSLWLIARRFGVSLRALIEWNAIEARRVLRPGQVLRIAAPDAVR